MAAGLPVLTNCPGLVAHTVATAGAGWSVQPGALSDGLKEVLVADVAGSLRSVEGRRGQQWLEANQSRGAMADRLAMVLMEARRRKNGGRA